MKAVLIGSAVYSENSQDVDLIADLEFLEKYQSENPLEQKIEGPLGTSYIFKNLDLPVEIKVPNPETAHSKVLEYESNQSFKLIKSAGSWVPVHQARLTTLAALKKAHLIYPHKWERHIEQYQELKKLLGLTEFNPKEFEPEIQGIYKLHRKEIKTFAKPHPKLNVSKDSFFEEAEFKIFDHDSIHRAIALGQVPAYTLMQDGEVWCSKEKWQKLNHSEKMRCVIEEACVLALERSIIPALFLGKAYRGTQWAYEFALSKVCTTITSGFFRDFSIEHYQEAKTNRPNYSEKFFEGIKKDVVKVLKPEVVGSRLDEVPS